jgi:uncharacterized protein YndB with AHSA1/START domain
MEKHTQVRRQRTLDAAPEEVWRAITDPVLLCEWLAEEVDFEAVEGAEVSFGFDGEERLGTIEEVAEPERLVYSWTRPGEAASRVELTIEALPQGSRLSVVETAVAAGPLALAGGLWEARLESLERLLNLALVA